MATTLLPLSVRRSFDEEMRTVGVFGPPRSGTSWLAHIFNSHPNVTLRFQPLFSYGHKNALDETSSLAKIKTFFDDVLKSQDDFVLMRTDFHKNYPTFSNKLNLTHLVTKEVSHLNIIENLMAKDRDLQVVGLIRNPLATLASWMTAPREFAQDWNISEEWRDAPKKNRGEPAQYYGYLKWKSAALSFLELEACYSDRFKLVEYSSLKNDTFNCVSQLFKFCDLAVTAQTIRFIEATKSRHDSDPYSVFRSDADDDRWHEVLPMNIAREIEDDLDGTALERFLNK